jgi:hypothetical protein
VTPHSQRIAQAVDDEDWQRFRVSLKGLKTPAKLVALHAYYINGINQPGYTDDIFIRVDNYLKALARGGLVVLEGSFDTDFKHVRIVKE